MKTQNKIYEVAKIVSDGVTKFSGEKQYLATGGLDTSEVDELTSVTYQNRPSRADLTAKPMDVILARMKDTNKVLLIDETLSNYIFSTGFIILRPTEKIIPQYLYFYLKSKQFQSTKNKYCTGATQKAINNDNFKKISIPLVNKDRQEKVVSILQECEENIARNKTQLRDIECFLKAYFIKLFGTPQSNSTWETFELKDLVVKVVDCPHSTPKYTEETSDVYPCLRSSDLQNGFVDLSTTKYVNKAEYIKRIKRHQPAGGEIIFCREGARLGNSAIIPTNINACLGQRMMLLIPNNKVSKEFLWGVMNSEFFMAQLRKSKGGAAAPRVNIKDLVKMKIIVPSMTLQKEYSAIYKDVEIIKKKIMESLSENQHLVEALSRNLFKDNYEN